MLAREFETALREGGFDAALEPLSAEALEHGPGAAHLFNVDRYFEFASATALLQRSGRPYVVSPVHHPVEFVERFESDVRSGPLGLIAKAGRGPFGRERIKHVLRGRSGRAAQESLRRDPRGAIGQALQRAALVVVQAPAELDEVARTFGVDVGARSAWVPNGVSFDADEPGTGVRDIDVLVAGRIEERKNQLAIAKALGGTPWRVTFVGGDNQRNKAYAERFHREIAEQENLRHVPHVSLPELRGLYARSRVFLSASFFEVVSLSELEAVAHGCQLVSTISGYMNDYLGDMATYMDPLAPAEVIRAFVAAALDRGVNADGMAHVRREYTWARSHAALVEAYEQAGLSRS